jgi:hypothetical protein
MQLINQKIADLYVGIGAGSDVLRFNKIYEITSVCLLG